MNESHHTNDFDSVLMVWQISRNAYQSNALIGYVNINSLREKIVSLREVLSKVFIEICVDETKLDASFPYHQLKI